MQLLESIILGFWVFNCQRLFIPGVGGSEVRFYSLGVVPDKLGKLELVHRHLVELGLVL